MSTIMWQPTSDQVHLTQMDQFRRIVNKKFNLQIDSYENLHDWSVNNIRQFWEEMWGYGDTIYSEPYKEAVDDLTKMPGAK